jgi:hypothetical protein
MGWARMEEVDPCKDRFRPHICLVFPALLICVGWGLGLGLIRFVSLTLQRIQKENVVLLFYTPPHFPGFWLLSLSHSLSLSLPLSPPFLFSLLPRSICPSCVFRDK